VSNDKDLHKNSSRFASSREIVFCTGSADEIFYDTIITRELKDRVHGETGWRHWGKALPGPLRVGPKQQYAVSNLIAFHDHMTDYFNGIRFFS
jgi:hypothetical protein